MSLLLDQHPLNKSITIGLFGAPNVGKSSLINKILGYELSIVSSKPQTTRNRFNCISVIDRTEIVFTDSPGIHRTNKEFNKRMNGESAIAVAGSDINFLILDARFPLGHQSDVSTQELIWNYFFQEYQLTAKKVWIIFNKTDLVDKDQLYFSQIFKTIQDEHPEVERFFCTSAATGNGVKELEQAILATAPSGPHLFPNGDVSNKNMRFFAAEYIREQAFKFLKDEVPFELAVLIESYEDYEVKGEPHSRILANIVVARPGQRAIVVGSKGSMIKKIGIAAREKIQQMTGGKIHLKLHVKISEGWYKKHHFLKEIGLDRSQNSNRVWRSRS